VSGKQTAREHSDPKADLPSPVQNFRWLTNISDIELVVQKDSHDGHGPS
jgi:hypothetical protein